MAVETLAETNTSGFVTSDGKDLDERYLKSDNDQVTDLVCDIALQNIGVIQQSPINGTTNPYTLPISGYCNITAKYNVSALGGTHTEVHILKNGETVSTNTLETGGYVGEYFDWTVTTYWSGHCDQGDEISASASGGILQSLNLTVSASPYALYLKEDEDA